MTQSYSLRVFVLALLVSTGSACSDSKSARQPDAGMADAPMALDATVDILSIESEPGLLAISDELYVYELEALATGALSYQLLNAPTGMSISDGGIVEWTANSTQGGAHDIVVEVSSPTQTKEQSYQLQVAVPKKVDEQEISTAGGSLEGGGIRIDIPADAVSEPTLLSLWVLEQGELPLWEEMELQSAPFVLRDESGANLAIPATITVTPLTAIPADAQVFLARETSQAHAAGISVPNTIILDPTSSGPTASEISADLNLLDAYVKMDAFWMAFVSLRVRVFEGNGATVVWAYNGLSFADPSMLSNLILEAVTTAHDTATGTMGCDAPAKSLVYVATFRSGATALGVEYNRKVYLNKAALEDATEAEARDTIAHEYFHVVQEHMVDSIALGWWAEPTAEHGAGMIFNENLSHLSFGSMAYDVARLGMAPQTSEKKDFHKYQLYIYFSFLQETQGWRVCDFYRSQKANLQIDNFAAAMSSDLGYVDYPLSFRNFVEAYLFYRDTASFGDDAPGIGNWAPNTVAFATGAADFNEPSFRGGTGVKVELNSTESQDLLVVLEGTLVDTPGSLPMGIIRDENKKELGVFDGLTKQIALGDITAQALYITVTQGLMSEHGKASSVRISVLENGVVVSNQSSQSTDEDGGALTFDLALASDPGELSVTVTITSSDLSEATVDLSEFTFNTTNWNMPQTVTVTGQSDSEFDGDIAYTVDLEVTSPTVWQRTTEVNLVNTDTSCPPVTWVPAGTLTPTQDASGSSHYTCEVLADYWLAKNDELVDESLTDEILDFALGESLPIEITAHREHHSIDKAYTGAQYGAHDATKFIDQQTLHIGSFPSPWGPLREDISTQTTTSDWALLSVNDETSGGESSKTKVLTQMSYRKIADPDDSAKRICEIKFSYSVRDASVLATGNSNVERSTTVGTQEVTYRKGVREVVDIPGTPSTTTGEIWNYFSWLADSDAGECGYDSTYVSTLNYKRYSAP